MLRCLFICLLAVGCSGNSATHTTQAVQSKAEVKVYKPSELVDMVELPKGNILLKCRVLLFNKDRPGEIFLTVGDWEIAVGRDEPVIYVVLQADDGGFSNSILEWYDKLYRGSIQKLNGTVMRVEEGGKAVYMKCTGIN